MATAIIKLLKDYVDSIAFRGVDRAAAADTARVFLAKDKYRTLTPIQVPNLAGEDVAEEMFGLTNNPSRDADSTLAELGDRSVNVGDIVEVDNVNYLCCSIGWVRI